MSGAASARPAGPPFRPSEALLATIFHQLGIDATETFKDPTGRPHPMVDDPTPIKELV